MMFDFVTIIRIENHAEHGGTLNEHQLNRLVSEFLGFYFAYFRYTDSPWFLLEIFFICQIATDGNDCVIANKIIPGNLHY